MNFCIYKGLFCLFVHKKTAKISIFILNFLAVIYMLSFKRFNYPESIAKIGAAALGILFMFFSLSVICLFFQYILKKKQNKIDIQRRKFLEQSFKACTLGAGSLYIGTGFFNGIQIPKIKNIFIQIKNLQQDIKIVHLSDIHIGLFLQKKFLKELVKKTNAQNPDIVVITGDIIDKKASQIGDIFTPLQDIQAKYGTFYVPGNHEYFFGVREIIEKIKQQGVTVLGNSSQQVGDINLSGVYDLAGFRLNHELSPNLDEALANTNPDLPTILLAHQPKFIKFIQKNHRIDLMLSGHTHGGQIFPFSLLVLLDQPYLHGLYQHTEKMQIYVNSGAGFWGPPIRFAAPAEIAVLHLTKAKS